MPVVRVMYLAGEIAMAVYSFNPLDSSQWEELVQHHPAGSVFHTTGWLKALNRVYGYSPIVYTTCRPGTALTHGIVFCHVDSWLTGRRLVSLPFADHCEPLVESASQIGEILGFLRDTLGPARLRYVEIRPLRSELATEPGMHASAFYWLHVLRLHPSLECLFRAFNQKSIQRRIRRAASEPLRYEEGCSGEILKKFYHLLVLTRRRHNLPPQPIEWFRHLAAFLGDRMTIRVLSFRGQPVASILTLRHLATLVYKYGCSDARYHHLGCMPFLIWKAIEAAGHMGLENLDFGRSEPANEGLIQFKDHFGASRSILAYTRMYAPPASKAADLPSLQFAKRIFAHMPSVLLEASGRLVYRHMG